MDFAFYQCDMQVCVSCVNRPGTIFVGVWWPCLPLVSKWVSVFRIFKFNVTKQRKRSSISLLPRCAPLLLPSNETHELVLSICFMMYVQYVCKKLYKEPDFSLQFGVKTSPTFGERGRMEQMRLRILKEGSCRPCLTSTDEKPKQRTPLR